MTISIRFKFQWSGNVAAIARQIVVEKHGGSLDVQSELGQGTSFCIRLPIHYG